LIVSRPTNEQATRKRWPYYTRTLFKRHRWLRL